MTLNQNNFLRWEGEFAKAEIDVIAGNITNGWPQGGQLSYEVELLPAMSATYGVDESSIQISTAETPITPPVWSAKRERLIYYADSRNDSGNKIVKYRFRDKAGNLSNEGTVTFEIGPRASRFTGYPPSASCNLSSGVNSGVVHFPFRYRIYEADHEPVMPLEIVDNTNPLDPDQIPDYLDYRYCPLIEFTANIYVINNSDVVFPFSLRLTFGTTEYDYTLEMRANSSIMVKGLPGLATKLNIYGGPLNPKPAHRMVVRQSGSPDLVAPYAEFSSGAEVSSPNIYDTMQVIIEPLF